MYSSAMSIYSRVFKNGNYLSILRQLMALFLPLTIAFLKKLVYHQNCHFMLSRILLVPILYIKVIISYIYIININYRKNVPMYCFSCYLALQFEKYLQYIIDITTEQSVRYMELIDAKIWIFKNAVLCCVFANWVTFMDNQKCEQL